MYISIIAASPLLAIRYAVIIHDVASVKTLNMAKNALPHVDDTLQMDWRSLFLVFVRSLPFALFSGAPPRLAMISLSPATLRVSRDRPPAAAEH